MPVRGLDFYFNTITTSHPTNSLSNKRIAIDASFYIKKLLLKINEPFIAATGGIPISYKTILEQHINHLTKTLHITPFFVFNGIFWKKEKPFTYDDKRPHMRVLGWQEVRSGEYLKAAGIMGGSNSGVGVYDLYQVSMDVLDEIGVEWIRAPYLAVAQISVMEEYFHGVYAGSEYLMFGSSSSVLIIDIERSEISSSGKSSGKGTTTSASSGTTTTFVRKQDIINLMGLSNHDQFLDVCCLAGFDYASTCVELSRGGGFSFERVVEYVKAGRVPADKESYERTKLMVSCHPVISGDGDGKVKLMSDNYSMVDMRDIFGVRLPDYVYYSLSRGMINSQLLQTIITGYQVETYPLISGERYVEFVKSDLLLGLKSGVYELLGDILPFKPQIDVYYYFDSQVGYPLVIGGDVSSKRRNDIGALLSKKEEEVDEVVIILRELIKEDIVFKDVALFEEVVCRIGCFVEYDELLTEYLDIDLLEFVCVVRNIERNLRNYLEIFQLLSSTSGGKSRLFTREYSTRGGIVMRKYFRGKVSEKEMRHVRKVVGVCERVAESVKEIVGLDVKKLSKIK